MATEINIATYDKNGVPVCRPMTDDELAEFLAMQQEATDETPSTD
jgi:hypothetical protein